jgi:glycosyltransferase involved in cell wall biosynthesis
MTEILFMEDRIENPGGGVQAMKTMEKKLSQDYDTDILWVDEEDDEDSVGFLSRKISKLAPLEVGRLGYFTEPRLRNKTAEKISKIDPDIIFAQRRTGEIALQYARKNDAKVVLLLHDFELLYDPEFTHSGNNPVSKILNTVLRPVNRYFADRVLDRVDKIIFNSNFTAEKYDRDEKSEIIYPFIDTENYKVEGTGEKILHINATKRKGVHITLEVAERMSDEEFLIMKGPGQPSEEIMNKINSLENVEYRGFIEDIKDAYREAKILLVPSNDEETFGRLPVEVGISGIPSIVSGNGGLKESVGNEDFVVHENNTKHYVKKIKEIEKNYEEYSKKATENAQEKDYAIYLKKFEEIIREIRGA